MLTRAQLLGQIMTNYKYSVAVSGTHGKTTTTAMLSYIMLEADVDPTISVGGIIDDIGGNIRVGSSDYFVTEACEYTNSFHAFSPYISIILNVDADHLDFFSGIEEIAESFHTFATKTPENGKVIVYIMLSEYMKCDVCNIFPVDHEGIGRTTEFIKTDICGAVMILWVFTEGDNLTFQISRYRIKIFHISIILNVDADH